MERDKETKGHSYFLKYDIKLGNPRWMRNCILIKIGQVVARLSLIYLTLSLSKEINKPTAQGIQILDEHSVKVW